MPDTSLLDCIPVIMAGIISIYSLVVSMMIANAMKPETHIFTGFTHLGAGLAVGICGLGAGFAIGITGDAGVRAVVQQPRMFVGMMLIQIFAEVLGKLYSFCSSDSNLVGQCAEIILRIVRHGYCTDDALKHFKHSLLIEVVHTTSKSRFVKYRVLQ